MKNILIVGASRGIGLALAKHLHQSHNLITASRTSSDELEALGTQHLSIDASDENAAWDGQLPEVLHGLVYCPGTINLKPINRLSRKDFIDDFTTNVLGAVHVIQRALPALKAAKGSSIVLYSTVAVKAGMGFHSSVAASKAAIEGLGRSLAAELAPYAVRVNVIAPSLTDTSLASALLSTPEKREAAAKRHPLQQVGDPADVA
ncbi:MAG TPA: SDR family oxidoreductase, partial [Luteibaculaceae bacterium]|nr:SDR family oxidoreductase [Luteibaculaceae bacterium]